MARLSNSLSTPNLDLKVFAVQQSLYTYVNIHSFYFIILYPKSKITECILADCNNSACVVSLKRSTHKHCVIGCELSVTGENFQRGTRFHFPPRWRMIRHKQSNPFPSTYYSPFTCHVVSEELLQ